MAQPEKTLILLQLNVDCSARPCPPLLSQPWLTLKCTFTSLNAFTWQAGGDEVMVENPPPAPPSAEARSPQPFSS